MTDLTPIPEKQRALMFDSLLNAELQQAIRHRYGCNVDLSRRVFDELHYLTNQLLRARAEIADLKERLPAALRMQ